MRYNVEASTLYTYSNVLYDTKYVLWIIILNNFYRHPSLIGVANEKLLAKCMGRSFRGIIGNSKTRRVFNKNQCTIWCVYD